MISCSYIIENVFPCRFIAALTKGGPGGMPRPIEMHAHDPRRYLGDMLAWVHQSLASEKEFLNSLFGSDQADSVTSASIETMRTSKDLDRLSSQDSRELASRDLGSSEVLRTGYLSEKIFGSICRPLKVSLQYCYSKKTRNEIYIIPNIYIIGVL